MIRQGRKIRINHRSRKPRKESKTIPIFGSSERGDGEDHGRYFRCWNCGFICDSDRDWLGSDEDSARITPTAYTQLDQYGNTSYHCQGAAGDDQTTCEAAGGTWSSIRYKPVVDAGCPFCGTTNYKGN